MANKSWKLPKSWTTVTPLSKGLALTMFILLPIFAFHLGKIVERGDVPGFCFSHYKKVAAPANN